VFTSLPDRASGRTARSLAAQEQITRVWKKIAKHAAATSRPFYRGTTR
jgi:hypothetical protein